MRVKQNPRSGERPAAIFAAAAFLVLCFFVSQHVNIYLWGTLHTRIFPAAFLMLTAAFLFFYARSLTIEAKLLLAFWLWFLISRLLNGVEVLEREFVPVVDCGVFFLMGSVGLVLNAEQRRKALNWFGGFTCGYYTLLGVVSIVCSLLRITIVNPITEKNICEMGVQGFARLGLLDTNPNVTSTWFFIALSMLLYFFFSCRKKLWRVPIVIAWLINYFAFTLTYCRNMKVGFSVCAAMFVMLIALKRPALKKPWRKAAVIVLSAVIFLPLTYKSFDVPEYILSRASTAICAGWENGQAADDMTETADVQTGMPEAPAAMPDGTIPREDSLIEGADPENDQFDDPRDFVKSLLTLSDRTQIFESAFITLRQEPIRLLRGCSADKIMSIAQPLLPLRNVHFHNFLLQTLVYTGLAGFAIVLIYSLLLLIRMVRFFFSEDERAGFAEKLLILPLSALLLYNMLEPLLFNYTDFSVLFFFFIAGIFLGYSHELHPPKQKN